MITHFPETFMKLSTMIVMGSARTSTPEMIAPLAINLPAENELDVFKIQVAAHKHIYSKKYNIYIRII